MTPEARLPLELVHTELEVARVSSFSSSWEGQITVNQLLIHPHYSRPTALNPPLLTSRDPITPSASHLILIPSHLPTPIPQLYTKAASSQTLAQQQELV